MRKSGKYSDLPIESNIYRNELNDLENGEDFFDPIDGLNKRSIAWKYFDYDQKSNVACCKLCYAVYTVRKSVTTPMMKHLREQHFNHFSNRVQRRFREQEKPRRRERQYNYPQPQERNQLMRQNYINSQRKKQLTKNYIFINDQKAVCQKCNKTITYNEQQTILLQHLFNAHSNKNDLNEQEQEAEGGTRKQNIYFDDSEDESEEKREAADKKPENKKEMEQQEGLQRYFMLGEGENKLMCKLCREQIALDKQQNYINHLKQFHPTIFIQTPDNQLTQKKTEHSDGKQVSKSIMIDKNNCIAICELCQSIYLTHGIGFPQFLKHIEIMHPGIQVQKQFYEGCINTNKFFGQSFKDILFNKVELSEECMKELVSERSMRNFPNLLRLQDKNAQGYREFMQFCWGCFPESLNQSGELERLLGQFGKLGFMLGYHHSQNILSNITFTQNFPTSQDTTISFWEIPNNKPNTNLKSILFITKSSVGVKPSFQGFSLILKDSIESYMSVLQKFKSIYHRGTKLTLCYQQGTNLHKSIQIFNQNFNIHPSNLLELPFEVFTGKDLTSVKEITSKLFSGEYQGIVFFIGLILSKQFIAPIKQVAADNIFNSHKLTDIFSSLLASLIQNNKPKLSYKLPLTRTNFMNSQLQKLIKLLSPDIFNKLCIIYLYSQTLKLSHKGNNLLMMEYLERNTDSQLLSNFVKYDFVTQEIKCDCNFMKWVGLPCPHIVRVSVDYKIPIKQLISTHWLQQSAQNIYNPLNVQFSENEPIIKSQEQFKELFWQ